MPAKRQALNQARIAPLLPGKARDRRLPAGEPMSAFGGGKLEL